MKLNSEASWQTVLRGQQGIMHLKDSPSSEMSGSTEDMKMTWGRGWTQEDKLIHRVINMFFPKIYECLRVYLPNENKNSGFFKETK